MSARQDMTRLLEQWFWLTRAEAEAIQAAAWQKLNRIQTTKAELQIQITETNRRWKKENPEDWQAAEGGHPLRAEACRLISLEARNQDLLAAQRRRAEGRKELLDQAARNLRKVQGSYARQRSSARLACYS